MEYSVFSDAQWTFPDMPFKNNPGKVKVSIARGGHSGFQIIGEKVSPGDNVSVFLDWREDIPLKVKIYELLPVCVNENTAPDFMTTTKYESCKEFVTRKAPFYVYDAIKPFSGIVSGNRLAFYVCIEAENQMNAGKYSGNLCICCGSSATKISVECVVHHCVVPEIKRAKLGMINFLSYENISVQHNVKPNSEEYWKLFRQYVKAQLKMRCTHIILPEGKAVYVNGKLQKFDFSQTEHAGKIAVEEGAPWLCGGHIAHWNEWNEHEYFVIWDKNMGVTTYEGYFQLRMYFSQWAKVIKRNHWQNNICQALADEPQEYNADTYRILAAICRKFLPQVPILDAVETTNLGGGIDIWVPKQDTYEKQKEKFDKLKNAGEQIWFYTCAFPAGSMMNRSMDLPLTASRAVLWMGAFYRLSGFLHWGFNYYVGKNIWRSACCPHKGAWLPAGDAHIVYPGGNGELWLSMRFEAQRSGAEEYELFMQAIEKDGYYADLIIKEVCESFSKYTSNADVLIESREKLLYFLDEQLVSSCNNSKDEKKHTMAYAKKPYFVFYADDSTGSKHFRIPFLWTTPFDTLIAGIDANFGSGGDSAENIDMAVRRKPHAEEYTEFDGWQDAFVPNAMHMQDYADEDGYKQKSASFIDGVIVQDTIRTNRIFILADAFAWNGGIFQHLNSDKQNSEYGSVVRQVALKDGFCNICGKKYLLLSSKNKKGSANGQIENINENLNYKDFDYAADIYGSCNADGRYDIYHLLSCSLKENACLDQKDTDNFVLGDLSKYSLNKDYEIYKNGEKLTVTQKSADIKKPQIKVPMKIFYEDSELQMYNTSYIMQFYSDDDGKTWRTDKIISGMVKRKDSRHYILGPGRGIQLKNGKYAGRLVVPVYYNNNISVCEVIYSDDNAQTWHHGEKVKAKCGLSEAALVEMPNGTLKLFARNTDLFGGMILEAASIDAGQTWTDAKSTFGDDGEGVNCQISAIKYSRKVWSSKDQKYYSAVMLSTAGSRNRKHGCIFTGLIKENGNYSNGVAKCDIDWEYCYDITNKDKLFAYSCLTELPNGRIAIMYESSKTESWEDGLCRCYYKEFSIDDLISQKNLFFNKRQ